MHLRPFCPHLNRSQDFLQHLGAVVVRSIRISLLSCIVDRQVCDDIGPWRFTSRVAMGSLLEAGTGGHALVHRSLQGRSSRTPWAFDYIDEMKTETA